jgi:hypothetical protein
MRALCPARKLCPEKDIPAAAIPPIMIITGLQIFMYLVKFVMQIFEKAPSTVCILIYCLSVLLPHYLKERRFLSISKTNGVFATAEIL